MKGFIVLCLAVALTSAQKKFQCPEHDGEYEDEEQCDKYYECVDGVATAKLCPDGLVFDPKIRKINKCDHIFNVDCEYKDKRQPPQGNEKCPRRNGFFPHEDPSACSVFYNCIEGAATETSCTPGLFFDENTGICDWPHNINKAECTAPRNRLPDGFECPREMVHDSLGLFISHPMFAHPKDCQKFYVCLSGVEPRLLECGEGLVYNEQTTKCDTPESVPDCIDWFKDDEDQPPPPPNKRQ